MTSTARPLPPGWAEVSLGSICEAINGRAFKKSEWRTSGLPIIRIENLKDASAPFNYFRGDVRAVHRVAPGDLLFAWSGTPGTSFGAFIWNGPDAVLNQHIFNVRFDGSAIASRFLTHALNERVQFFIAGAQGGVGLAHITKSKFLASRVWIAPLPEQHRIADTIDLESFRLDAVVAALKYVAGNLRRYRASVLQAAVEGRLVPTEAELAYQEGRNYEPAPVLLRRILAERRQQWEEAELAAMAKKGRVPKDDEWKARYKEPESPSRDGLPALPEGWCWASMGQLLFGIEAGKNFKCIERPPADGEVGVVKVSAVTWGHFDEMASKTCPRQEQVNPRYMIQPGDFLFSRANTIALVGACVVVDSFVKRLMLSDKILRLKLPGGLSRWVMWALRSWLGRREIEYLATGNQESMRNISQASIAQIRIPLPPPSERDRILDDLESKITLAEELGQFGNDNRTRLQRLRRSILGWAFQGKLVDQNPQDEPASALLGRTQAERSSQNDKGRTPRARGRSVG